MKVLLIGGSKGLGESIRKRLEYKKHEVVYMSRTYATDSEDYSWIPVDLKKSEQHIKNSVSAAIERLKGIDALVISSGYAPQSPIYPSLEEMGDIMQVNFFGPALVYKACLRELLKSKGKAIFISSTVSRKPGARWLSSYAASKGALNSWMISEANRAARKGVGLCIVQPGWFFGGMADNLDADTVSKSTKAIPFKRFGKRGEIADFVLSILNQSNWCISGNIYEVSGGA